MALPTEKKIDLALKLTSSIAVILITIFSLFVLINQVKTESKVYPIYNQDSDNSVVLG